MVDAVPGATAHDSEGRGRDGAVEACAARDGKHGVVGEARRLEDGPLVVLRGEAAVRADERSVGHADTKGVQVDFPMRHVAETAPFLAPPLDLDDNEHAIRRISTPLITMGLFSRLRAAPFEV